MEMNAPCNLQTFKGAKSQFANCQTPDWRRKAQMLFGVFSAFGCPVCSDEDPMMQDVLICDDRGLAVEENMKATLFMIGSLVASLVLKPNGQGAPEARATEGEDAPSPPGTPAKLSPLSGSNGFTAVAPERALWQFGVPTARTNKFNPLLPTNLPPPAADTHGLGTNQARRATNLLAAGTNQTGAVAKLTTPTGSNEFTVVAPEPVLWQFGMPTTRTNKFNPVLPTNLPPPGADTHGLGTNQPRGTNHIAGGTNPTNQSDIATLLSPLSPSNGFTAVVPEPRLWQFGTPTSRTNKFNPLLPTNLPPPVTNEK
jgi:hypothetical protein